MSGGGIAVGGGGIGLIIAIVIVAVNAFGGDASVLEDLSGVTVGGGQTSSEPLDCRTGADAQDREDCRIVAYVNSIQGYWRRLGANYRSRQTVFFTDQTSSACGTATTDVGPFYCPADGKVYIDLGFFHELTGSFRCAGRPARGGLRPGARVRAPRAGSPRDCSIGDERASRDPRATPSARSCRRTATRACGQRTPSTPGSSPRSPIRTSPTRSMPPRRLATIGSSGRRRATSTRDVDARIVGGTQQWFRTGYHVGRPERLRHLQRFGLTVRDGQLRPLLLRTRSTTQRIVSTNDSRASSVESFASVMSG